MEGRELASWHDGGRIKIGQDEKLYATVGDASNSAIAQDPNSLGGKNSWIESTVHCMKKLEFNDFKAFSYSSI